MYPIIPIFIVAGAILPVFAQPMKHLGELKAGPVVTAEVPLYFPGPGAVTLDGVEVGCGCLRASVPVQMLRAGESTTLRVELNTLAQPTGPNTWYVKVHRTSIGHSLPMRDWFDVRLMADVVREVDVSPPAIALSTTGTASQTVTITDRRAKPLTITSAKTETPGLTVALALPVGGVQKLTVTLAADAPTGDRTAIVALATDDPAYPLLRLPVTISKRPVADVVATPATLELRDGVTTAVVLIRSPVGRIVKVSTATCDSTAVQLKWADGTGPTAAVRVTVSGERGSTVVRVTLTEPVGETLAIPVTWGGP